MSAGPPHLARSARSWEEFRATVEELEGVPLEDTWLGSKIPHRVRCTAGHEAKPSSNSCAARPRALSPMRLQRSSDGLGTGRTRRWSTRDPGQFPGQLTSA